MRHMTMPGTFLALAAMLVVGGSVPSTAAAQEDARWLPWLGCWESVGEDAPAGLLCVRPTAGGVEMLSVVDGGVVATETLTADGRPHALEREGCTGTQSARFSSDHRRLFLTSEHTCEGEFERESTGLMAMTSPSTWIDVQVVDAGGRDMAWVRHYRQASESRVEEAGFSALTAGRGMALRTARYDAVAALDLEDVAEATRNVHAEAVKAWVAEVGEPFDLDARGLLRLADAGVDPDIIDVMVAVSYPERFAVADEGAEPQRYADERYDDPYGRRGYDRWGPHRYGYGYGYRYDPYFSPWGGYGGYYRYNPTVIVVRPVDGTPSSGGRMVKGRGYTRRGSSDSSRGGSGAVVPTRSGGSGSGSVSSGSSGSSGTSTGRKAKKRGGGGGDDEGGGGLF